MLGRLHTAAAARSAVAGAPGSFTAPQQLFVTLPFFCRLWIKYKFTNKRLIVTTSSPILKREVQARWWGSAAKTLL